MNAMNCTNHGLSHMRNLSNIPKEGCNIQGIQNALKQPRSEPDTYAQRQLAHHIGPEVILLYTILPFEYLLCVSRRGLSLLLKHSSFRPIKRARFELSLLYFQLITPCCTRNCGKMTSEINVNNRKLLKLAQKLATSRKPTVHLCSRLRTHRKVRNQLRTCQINLDMSRLKNQVRNQLRTQKSCELVGNPNELVADPSELVANPSCEPGFATSFQLVRLVDCGLIKTNTTVQQMLTPVYGID